MVWDNQSITVKLLYQIYFSCRYLMPPYVADIWDGIKVAQRGLQWLGVSALDATP
jgi:hypothetical protein